MSLPANNVNPIRVLFAVTAVILVLALTHLTTNPGELSETDYLLIETTEVLPQNLSYQQASLEEAWLPITLPFNWRGQFPPTRVAWYRSTLSRADIESMQRETTHPDEALLGLYIWRVNQTADIWFNGQKVGSGGANREVPPRHWNSPLYFSFPAGLVRDNNEIYVRHFAAHTWGSMEALVLAPDDVLKPVYERRYFIQHDIALGLLVFVMVTGIFCLAVWAFRPQEKQYLWFAIACVGLSMVSLNQFIRDLPVAPDTWRWLLNVSFDLWASATCLFVLRSLGLYRPRLEKLIMLYLLSGVPVYYYASFYQMFDINVYYHAGYLLIGVYGMALNIHQYVTTRNSLAAFYIGGIGLLLLAGVHDILMQGAVNLGWGDVFQTDFQDHYNFTHFVAPVLFLAIGASLLQRFINSMNAADQLNLKLEQRVEDARIELAKSYKAIEQALVYRATSEERERIYRDLHDDVGSKLLSLFYRLGEGPDGTLAKSALEDLRDIVSRQAGEGSELLAATEQWHREAFERVNDAGLTLNWQFHADEQGLVLNESQNVQLRRMLREVLSNAILHSTSATEICVMINAIAGRLAIAITNDGVMNPASDWKAGRGVNNLRIRVRDLKGELAITDIEKGKVEVAWEIPLDPAGDEQHG